MNSKPFGETLGAGLSSAIAQDLKILAGLVSEAARNRAVSLPGEKLFAGLRDAVKAIGGETTPMRELHNEPVVRAIIDEIAHELETCGQELGEVTPLGLTDDPYLSDYHLLHHPVPVNRHPAFLRGKIAVLQEAAERLAAAQTAADLASIYTDVILVNLFGGEYCSTSGRVSLALRLRNRFDEVFKTLGIDPALPTQAPPRLQSGSN